MSELPKGWAECRLDDISAIITGKTPSKKNAEYFGGSIPFIKPGDVNNQGFIEFTQETLTELGAKTVPIIPKNSITVTCIGNLGRVGITTKESVTNQQINTVVVNPLINYRFIYHYIRTLQHWMESEASATTVSIINKSKFSAAPVYLAPRNEQIRIADKLDSILAKVNKAQSRLDKIPAILKRFRQSVLAAATSGELTKEWREDNQVNVNWREIKVSDIVSKIEAGKSIKCDERPPNGDEFGIIKISAVTWGVYNEEESKTLKDKSVFLESRRVNVGDFLISRANTLELLGMPVIVHKTTKNLMLSDKVLRLVMDDLNKKWLNYYFRSPVGRLKIESGSSGNQESMRNIGQKSLMAIILNDPDLREKREIVRRVESLFSLAELVEKQFQDARKRTDRLTQSILNKAFRGELVAQNPNDEPASLLLEKIRSNRIKNSTKKISKNVNSKSKSAVTPSKLTATKKVVINQFSNRSKIENKEIASLSKEDAAYVKKAIQNLKDATFTVEQFQSVIGFNKTYEELKTLILTLVKGVSGISEPLIEVVDWNEKDGEYNFKLKDM